MDTQVNLPIGADVLFLMLGAVMVLAMHGGFAFLEVGTVRYKNQVNALVKILSDWSVCTVVYMVVGYYVAYGNGFLAPASALLGDTQGVELVRFFFLLAFAAAIPAIISGGIAERARFWPQVLAAALLVATVYPFFESLIWGQRQSFQLWLEGFAGAGFHDFAGSVVVHAMGGWLALTGIVVLGPRMGRYGADGSSRPFPPSSIPFLALGSWMLIVGWFGFNVMSAQSLAGISGLVAMNSLLALAGGVIAALIVGKNDPGFVHNGALAGLVAVCAGSDVMHPLGAVVTGAIGGALFVYMFHVTQERFRIDDVLGVWPLHGLAGAWGGIACGIFGLQGLGGLGGVSLMAQVIGTLLGIVVALVGGFAVYKLVDLTIGVRMSQADEYKGADLSIHHIGANPEERQGP
ncbi:MAG: ammonium transporter [Nitrospirota bacterium]|nr:ammonium transporter [Nitrospirota bacterium]